MRLPKDVKLILDLLEEKGYEAYAVGGCVRDTLLGKKPPVMLKGCPHKSVELPIIIYPDVNIIFGQKGTGKTEIIKSLKNHYEETGIKNCSYIGTEKDDDFQMCRIEIFRNIIPQRLVITLSKDID